MTSVLHYHIDRIFQDVYAAGLQRTGMPDSEYRRPRFYNLMQFFAFTQNVPGAIAEAGCYKGLSTYLLAHALLREHPHFTGKDFYVLDSFEGLSEPTPEDLTPSSQISPRAQAHLYCASLEQVRDALSEFHQTTFIQGWIPESLTSLPDQAYRFVHVDLDLYSPILESLRYFYPRLSPGGILVVDDYGYLDFPGARMAVEEYCEENKIHPIRLTTGNAVLMRG